MKKHTISSRTIRRPWLWVFGFLWPLAMGIPWSCVIGCRFDGKIGTFVVGMLLATSLFCAVTDVFCKKIYNWMTYPVFLMFVLLNLGMNFFHGPNVGTEKWGTVAPGNMFVGIVVCFLLALIPYAISQGGAGDVKLAAVIGAALGAYDGFLALCLTFVFSAMLGFMTVVWVRGPLVVLQAVFHRVGHWFLPLWISPASLEEKKLLKEPIPIAPCFFLGVFIVTTGFWHQFV